jgi:hypothetical protein
MQRKQNKWIQLLPPLLLLPLVIIPPIAEGSIYWGIGLMALCWSAVQIILFLIRTLWELADKGEADPDMSKILRSLLTVGVMILAFCSLAAGRTLAREQALTIAVRIQADCGLYESCPESLLPRHLKERNSENVGAWMTFPLRYQPYRNSNLFVLETILSYRERLVIEGGVGQVMKWHVARD